MVPVVKPIRKTVQHPRRQFERVVVGISRTLRGAPMEDPPRDVWRWTSRKYRVRTVVLLLVNAILFAGLGCFTHWLRTGDYTPFASGNYWQQWWAVFSPTREEQITLFDFLLKTIPVDQVPLMMVIVGLALGSLTAIPIMVAMLYRFPFALIFTAIIGFVALLPWLAIVLTLCCFLATWRPLRFSFRFATALLALLPTVAYYALATRNASSSVDLSQAEVAKLYIPWVLALVAACGVMAIVLIIAKASNYRPGAIAPLLAVMFAVPVILFEAEVGRAELYYRLLEARYGLRSTTHFVSCLDASEVIGRIAQRRLERIDDPRATLQSVMDQVRLQLQLQLESVQGDFNEELSLTNAAFAAQQHQAVDACDAFCERYPNSRYIPNALYLKGRAIDMRIDQKLFRTKHVIVHYQDFPNAASKLTWQTLHDGDPDSPLASVATYRLALLEARESHVDRAIGLLDDLIERFGQLRRHAETVVNGSVLANLLAKKPATKTLDVDPVAVVLEGRKLRTLLANNRDPQQKDLALCTLLRLDPRHAMYRENLRRLLADIPSRYPLTLLADNLQVLIAKTESSVSLRIEQLKCCVDALANAQESDALPHARFELGAAYQSDNRPAEARSAFEKVLHYHPDSPWAYEATRRLAAMGVAVRPLGQTVGTE